MDSFAKRKNIIIGILLIIGAIYVIRLFNLQIVDSTYKRSATRNVVREVIEFPSRGLIYDRNGEMLVYNQIVYDLLATPNEIGQFDTITLCSIIDVPKEVFTDELKMSLFIDKSFNKPDGCHLVRFQSFRGDKGCTESG